MAYELFCDSFDTETFSSYPLKQSSRWIIADIGNSVVSSSESAGRRGTSGARIALASGSNNSLQSRNFNNSSHVVAGFWLNKISGTPTFTFSFRSDTTTFVSVTVNSFGVVSTTFGGTTYQSINIFPVNDCYVEIGVIIGNAGALQVRVNGSVSGWLDLTNVDTQPAAITSVNNFRLNISGTSVTCIDDFYITYGDELKWLGDIRVDTLALTADSTPQDWTPDTGNAWERLNNTSAGYITGTTLDDESLFALADYTPATTAIHGVQVSAYARKTDAGSRSMAIEVKSDTTTDVGDTIALSDTTTEYRQVWLTDPDTSSAWTDGGLDALEIGVKVMD